MIGLDTNVLARYLLADDPRQAERARRLIEDSETELWIPVTVVLELAWVLRRQNVPSDVVVAHLREVFALGPMRVQLPTVIDRALAWAEQGMDIADAIHLALSERADRFATFDDTLIRDSGRLETLPRAALP